MTGALCRSLKYDLRLGEVSIRSTEILWNKIEKLQNRANYSPCNLDFINKIEGISNTALPLDLPTILFIKSKLQNGCFAPFCNSLILNEHAVFKGRFYLT